jgi:hypothetical protein
MANSANDLIRRAMRSLQALGGTEQPTASEANDALEAFNSLLDSWTAGEGLTAYEVLEQSFVLVPGQQSYTIGPGGNVNVVRPTDIIEAYIQDGGANNFLLNIRTRDRWNIIGNRGPTVTSQIPTDLFYDPQFPLGIINFFPTPNISYTCFFDSQLQQVTFASLATNLSMPPGYERAFVFNLAVEIAAMFGIPIPPMAPGQKNVTEIARESLANAKRRNIKEVIVDVDPSIVSRSYATYNIYQDRPGGGGSGGN